MVKVKFRNDEFEEEFEENEWDEEEAESTKGGNLKEFEYAVLVEKDDGEFFASTFLEIEAEGSGSSLEKCLNNIKAEIESILTEEMEETGQMPKLTTEEDLLAHKRVQKYLESGMKIKIVKIKLDMSLIEDGDDW